MASIRRQHTCSAAPTAEASITKCAHFTLASDAFRYRWPTAADAETALLMAESPCATPALRLIEFPPRCIDDLSLASVIRWLERIIFAADDFAAIADGELRVSFLELRYWAMNY
jgi:hypothetical protein